MAPFSLFFFFFFNYTQDAVAHGSRISRPCSTLDRTGVRHNQAVILSERDKKRLSVAPSYPARSKETRQWCW
jgi:hypothetical protein